MPALSAIPRRERRPDRLDAEAVEQLLLVCLDNLASLAALLHREPQALDNGELTRREWQVARLVTQGYSNRQMALELVVSERTVDTHVSHILRKLELSSRAQIAAWVVERQRGFRVLA